MTDNERTQSMVRLKQLYEMGELPEIAYEAALAALKDESKPPPARSVVAKDISGNIATGDQSRQIQTDTYIETQQVIAAPTQADPVRLRQAYLARLYEQASYLSLRGVDPKVASGDTDTRLHLEAIYTTLLTNTPYLPIRNLGKTDTEELDHALLIETADWMQQEQAARPPLLTAVEQLNKHAHLVLLGDPGSGKSTFVNFTALCLAGEALQQATDQPYRANLTLFTAPSPPDKERSENEDAEQERQPWDHGVLLPVLVILRDLAVHSLPPVSQQGRAEHLWRYICHELEKTELADYAPYLRRELLEKGGLILLDGLDEVPEAEERRVQIKEIVEEFAATFHRCRILITSRIYAYQQQAWQLTRFEDATLMPFRDSQIRHFVDRWYVHCADQGRFVIDDARGRAATLKHAIFASDRLQGLAQRPLLLTLMASLHAWRGGNLPERREELYADAVDLLLDRWERQRVVQDKTGTYQIIQPSLAEYLKIDREELQTVLNRLAFQIHATQLELVDAADISEDELVSALLEISRNAQTNPLLLIEYLSQRAGLILPRGVGVYSFPHRSFQTYLAAWHLTDEDYPDQLAALACNVPDRWREVALLAGAKAARGTASAIWSLVDALCHEEPSEWGEAQCWGAHLAGQALVETANLHRVSERNQRNLLLSVRGFCT
ncbi:hypothetical protein KFU94_38275 [Chloroflexi bacterium TSY]|nr:hypothetical protein [Chloroflexi bacterium TSY]